MTKFKITSGPSVLAESSDINMAIAAFEGIIAKFGNGDSYIISFSKETIDDKAVEVKPATEQTEENKKESK